VSGAGRSPREIVVGVDGSVPGRTALRWAAIEATRYSTPLRILHAYHWPWLDEPFAISDAERAPSVARAAEEIVSAAVDEARGVAPSVTITSAAVAGTPAAVLLHAAGPDALLVVGDRGHGGFARLLLGSVSSQVAMYAHCSVAIVRGRAQRIDGPVVVGVDGSDAAVCAIETAFQVAAARHTRLVAVHAWQEPVQPWRMPPDEFGLYGDQLIAYERGVLDGAMAGWSDKYPGVPIERRLVAGLPGPALAAATEDAQLLVIGAHGHNAVAALLLGSASRYALHHSACPVLVARGGTPTEPPTDEPLTDQASTDEAPTDEPTD
jgi:nucleotide-binding universal stress UspA family protein